MTTGSENSFGKKLARLRKGCGLSQSEIAQRISEHCAAITNRAVSKWETGDSLPDAMQFVWLCQILGVTDVVSTFLNIRSPEPLEGLSRIGRERALEYISLLKERPEFSEAIKRSTPRRIPLYDMPASAGTGVFLDSENYSMIEVDESIPEDANFAVRLSGDSMYPRFRDGQIVYVHQQQTLESGDIGIFILNGEAFCKKLDTENGLKLVSLNSKYQPIKIKYAYELRAVGKVLS